MFDTSSSLYIYGNVIEKWNLHLQVVFHVPGTGLYAFIHLIIVLIMSNKYFCFYFTQKNKTKHGEFKYLFKFPCVHACSVPSVMSNSLQLQGLYSTRILSPWDSPNKDTGWVAIPSSRGSYT